MREDVRDGAVEMGYDCQEWAGYNQAGQDQAGQDQPGEGQQRLIKNARP